MSIKHIIKIKKYLNKTKKNFTKQMRPRFEEQDEEDRTIEKDF